MNFVQPDIANNTHTSLLDTAKGFCLIAMVFIPGVLVLYGLPQTAFTVFASLVIPLMILVVISSLVRWVSGRGVNI